MIHILIIDRALTPESLRKAFRKAAMTGGGVLRLDATLSLADASDILDTWLPLIDERNLAFDVVRQFALHPSFVHLVREKLLCANKMEAAELLFARTQQE